MPGADWNASLTKPPRARPGDIAMPVSSRIVCTVAAALALAALAPGALAQDTPFREDGWAQLPDGRRWGSTNAVEVDRDGNIWVFERCGAALCAGSNVAPLVKLEPSGKYLRSFGAGMFIQPHGLFIDRDNNVWVTDAQGKDGKGHVAVKFDQNGKVLMTLGKPGVAGPGTDVFNQPTDVVVAANGDIFISDGHGGESNARIMKFSKDGRFIKTWGKKGSGPGEFDQPHGLAIDSQGRLFVADRANNRVQIFDQEGKLLAEWRQFGRPDGLFIDRNDVLYVVDHASTAKLNPGFKRGVRIGSVKDGVVKSFIPGIGAEGEPDGWMAGEGVTADLQGNVYWAESTGGWTVRKFVRK
jgi:sugar lactone lactonase YvrE